MTLEAVPTRPGAVDGFYSEGTEDGFYDEYPVDGFYGSVGYLSEFKPPRRATYTMEAVPSRGGSLRGAITDPGTRGAWTEDPQRGAYTQNDSYVLEIKP